MSNTQLNGWFGKLLKKLIVAVAAAVDDYTLGVFGLENHALSIGTGPTSSGWWTNKIATGEPTPAEEVILTNWNNSKFAPFCAKMAQRILDMQDSTSADQQVSIINEIKAQMCGVRSYFLTNETSGLQKIGIDTRIDLIDEAFLMLLSKINPVSEALGVEVSEITIPNFGNVFGNLITNYYNVGPVSCEKQFLPNSDVAPANVTQILQDNLNIQTTAQPTQGQGANPETTNKNPLKKIIIATGLGLALWMIFSGEEEVK